MARQLSWENTLVGTATSDDTIEIQPVPAPTDVETAGKSDWDQPPWHEARPWDKVLWDSMGDLHRWCGFGLPVDVPTDHRVWDHRWQVEIVLHHVTKHSGPLPRRAKEQ